MNEKATSIADILELIRLDDEGFDSYDQSATEFVPNTNNGQLVYVEYNRDFFREDDLFGKMHAKWDKLDSP